MEIILRLAIAAAATIGFGIILITMRDKIEQDDIVLTFIYWLFFLLLVPNS